MSREGASTQNTPAQDGHRPSGWHQKFIVKERFVPPATRKRLYAASLLLAVVGLGMFLVLLEAALTHTGFQRLDQPVNTWFMALRSPALTVIMTALAIIFGPIALPIIVLIVVVVWTLLAKHARRPLLLAAGMVTGMILAEILAQVASRLYLGYHWITDTTASVGLSLLILGAVMAIDTARTVRVPGEHVHGVHSQPQVDGT